MDFETTYLAWQGVPSKQSYYVQRWDDVLYKRVEGSALNVNGDQPLLSQWPASVMCLVDSNPLQRKPTLPDYLMNIEQWTVVSPRVKSFLEQTQVPEVEYLPVRVIDPTGLKLADAYYIVHTLNAPDCLDLDRCGAKRSRINKAKAEKIERLVFKRDPQRPLFRPFSYSKIAFLNWPLAEAMAEQGFTGFRFMGLFDYGLADLPPNPKRSAVDALCARLWKASQK